MRIANEVAVTLTAELFRQLSLEAKTTGVPLEWLVASIVVDTLEMPLRSVAG